MFERILNYWNSLEFFQPSWPIDEKKDVKLIKNNLPWPLAKPSPKKRISYDIYLGRAIAYDLIIWTFGILDRLAEDSPIERDQSKVCLCALKVDDKGVYIAGSFAVSSFVWALCAIVEAKDFNTKLDLGDMKKLEDQFNIKLAEEETPVSFNELTKLFEQVCENLGIKKEVITPSYWAKTIEENQKADGTFTELNPSTELMSSFYISEIARIKKNPDKRTRQYIEAIYTEKPQRIEIDSNTTAMQKCLEADRYPLGMWPSAYSPSLMQQLAINLAISGQDSFSVNGPPGTGKTTLLKEIIASNIVQRAILMAAYKKPDDAFQKDEFTSPPNQYNKSFYRPEGKLTAYGIVVASNNNAAVENISIELPKRIEKDRTGHFTNTNSIDETYFSDIATDLLKEEAWGIISARLGKRENLNKLKKRLGETKEGATLRQYYVDKPPTEKTHLNWETARQNFLFALKEVENERANIIKIQKMLNQFFEITKASHSETAKIAEFRTYLNKQDQIRNEQQAAVKELEDAYSLKQQNAALLKSSLSLLKHIVPGLFREDPLVLEWKQTKLAAAEMLIDITRQQTSLQTQNMTLAKEKQQLRQKEDALQKVQEQQKRLEIELEPARKRFGVNFADDDFWQDICANETSQSACPWTDRIYDTMREELFYRALMLQKAFVLGSNAVNQNLKRLVAMWEGNFTQQDREAAYGSLLNTLFFVVPVISTTFASVQKFLDGIHTGELGVLVVDEAGQATPQSALGALSRTRKAIIVGDPLQVEPIMNVPIELCRRFADENDMPTDYRIPELSVQMLADAQNRYGGFREIGDKQLWLGCPLVVHRRCTEPMFSMSNTVAYNGRMFYKTPPTKPETTFLLEKSIWFDISDKEVGNKDHTVYSQIDLVERLMKKAIIQCNGFPNIYIITPFKSVERSLKHKLKPLFKDLLPKIEEKEDHIRKWLKDNCGTIHTFQGKEANEVLLVLGCDNLTGKKAALWVGEKPNIINVAVSRAKNRLGVVGSYELWNTIPHVELVCSVLKDTVIQGKYFEP